jgi:tetratricopeptide (TPR) repeat protein
VNDGVRMWDLDTGDQVGFIPMYFFADLRFAASEGMVKNTQGGLLFWPTRSLATATGPEVRFGPSQYLTAGDWLGCGITEDGRVIAVPRRNAGAVVLHRERTERPIALQPQADAHNASISPDGAFVAVSTRSGKGGVKIWDAHSGRFIKELAVGTSPASAFSPDGKWLAATGTTGGMIVRVGTWEQGPKIGSVCCPTFSPDSRLLSMETSPGGIRLVDPVTGREKARLEDPNQDTANSCSFTPDGTRLVLSANDGQAIHVWDLRLVRTQLAELGLDWDEPPYAPPPPKVEPLRVTVVGAALAISPASMQTWELETYSLRMFENPFDADACFQRGRVHQQMNNRVSALADLDFALALEPSHVRARYLRGKVLQLQGRWQHASDDFTHLLQQTPNDYDLYRQRGICRVRLGDFAGAAADFGEWLKYGDQDANTLNMVAWQLVARAKERKYAELALPLIEKAVAQLPNEHLLNTLGVAYFRLGRFQEAITTLERASKLRGPQPTADDLYFLAMCRYKLGDAVAARRDLDQAIRWQQQAKLTAARAAELDAFRAEAEALVPAKTK